MRVYKSEGFKGNIKTTSYSTARYQGQQGQPEKEPRTGSKTAIKLAKIVTAIVTEVQRGSKANYTWLSDTEYVGSNHRCSHKTQLSDKVYTRPPGTLAATVVSRKNIFPKKGKSNASTY